MKELSEHLRSQLLLIAKQSILEGFKNGHPLIVNPHDEELQERRACFVTLEIEGNLRGCIGSLEAHQTLAQNVSRNAFNAAFQDARFQPLTEDEFTQTDIEISILTTPQEVSYASEEDLFRKLAPQVDGVIYEDGDNRSTFLPQVWKQLPTPREFMKQLKLKAGLGPGQSRPSAKIYRYQVEKFRSSSNQAAFS